MSDFVISLILLFNNSYLVVLQSFCIFYYYSKCEEKRETGISIWLTVTSKDGSDPFTSY